MTLLFPVGRIIVRFVFFQIVRFYTITFLFHNPIVISLGFAEIAFGTSIAITLWKMDQLVITTETHSGQSGSKEVIHGENIKMVNAIKNIFGFGLVGAAVLLAGSLTANAQGGYYGQNDGYYKQTRPNHKAHRKQEKRALKHHQKHEREDHGNSEALRRHQQAERRAIRQHQRYERNDGYNNGGYNNDSYNDNGYYGNNDRNRELAQQAVNQGYQQGYREGQQARQYGNRGGYGNQGYGNQGYGGGQYQQYYQQGYQRGYQDGYNRSSRYGTQRSGISTSILTSILGQILGR